MLTIFAALAARFRRSSDQDPLHILPRHSSKRRSSRAARRGAKSFRCRFEQCEERALLTFHLWKIDQVFSSADGKVQFIELHDPANGENHTAGHFISSNENNFTFPTDLSTDATANQHFLIATADYAKLPGAVKPDYIIPDNFFNPAGDTFDYADVDSFSFTAGQVPTDGVKSLMRDFNTFALSTGPNSETNLAGQTGPVTVTAPTPSPASLAITDSALGTDQPGTPLTYTITVANSGGTAATGASVSDTLPAGLTNITAIDPAGTVHVSGNTVTDSPGTLAATTGTETLTITATPGSSLAGTTVSNTATLTFNGATKTATANTAIGTSTPPTPTPAALAITVSGPATGQPGTPLTYTITIANTGGTTASGASVSETLPAGLTNITAVDTAGTVNLSGNTVTDILGLLAATSGSETLTITATPAQSLSGTSLTNTASLSFNGATKTASAVTAIGAPAPPTATTGAGFLTGTPGDAAVQTFVQNLYRELLGREPEQAGDSFWVNLLNQNNGAAGRSHVIEFFLDSPEYKTHFISSLYQTFLGRAPDAAGLAFWTAKMGAPGTPGQHSGSADEKFVLAALLGSDELFTRSGNTAQGWVNTLYEDLFGRAADGAGLDFFTKEVAVLGAGDRDGIVRDLLSTPEAEHDLLDAFYPTAAGQGGRSLAAPGTQAGTGATDLAMFIGAGWENLYLQGPSGSTPEANDSFFASLSGGGSWDDVQSLILNTDQFFNNPN